MAMSRAELVGEVGGLLAQALAVVGMPATDTAGALREPVNQTLRALGVAQATLATAIVADGQEATAVAFARYFVLDRLVDAAHDLINLSAPGGARLEQQGTVASLKAQRDEARTIAVARGLTGYTVQTGAGDAVSVAPIPLAGGLARVPYFTNYAGGGAGEW